MKGTRLWRPSSNQLMKSWRVAAASLRGTDPKVLDAQTSFKGANGALLCAQIQPDPAGISPSEIRWILLCYI